MPKYVCIHGHFYQPLRENPWLEMVEVQDSAAPFHDWNARVTAECYAPNSAARILGPQGVIEQIVNNYESISFNFGATLLGWLERHSPTVYEALLQADRDSAANWGHGGALAQVYHHLIMPLATERDRQTQIVWGLKDFEHRFGRRAQGMWLAETAVDTPTLEDLVTAGVEFTILSPFQCAAVRAPGQEAWAEADGGRVDPRRPYLVRLPSGGSITVFFYQAEISKAVAFENLLDDGGRFASRLKSGLDLGSPEDQLVLAATDGESYGHHHRFGEMALAFALEALHQDPEVELTNPATYLAHHPATWEAKIVERSSWSCAHGVERWRADCGCAVNPGSGWNQAWRAPLREGFDQVAARLAQIFEEAGGRLFQDPWAARNDYVELMWNNSPPARRLFLERHGRPGLTEADGLAAWRLLEMSRWAMTMFTSCGWFFDDIGGIEPIQNMWFAARAIQLARHLGVSGLEEELVNVLSRARSNEPQKGTGGDIWRRKVAPARVTPERVAVHAAISGVLGEEPPPGKLYCYDLVNEAHFHRGRLGLAVSWGRLQVTHRRLGAPHDLVYAALYPGGHDFTGWAYPSRGTESDEMLLSLGQELEGPLKLLDVEQMGSILDGCLGGEKHNMRAMFLEGRRSLAEQVLENTLERYAVAARNLYHSSRDLMLFMRKMNVPLPPVFTALAETMLTGELVAGLESGKAGPLGLGVGDLALQARTLGLKLGADKLRLALEERLAAQIKVIAREPADPSPLEWAHLLLDLAEALEVSPDLWESQNILYRLAQRLNGDISPGLAELGRRLNLDLA
ncbi:MAG: DUF3536 domain-containing protein [Deltaproteobacteria bacterium]|nr:DUF3536 domain-containing protein [Deltaproteobacteria bacterium]